MYKHTIYIYFKFKYLNTPHHHCHMFTIYKKIVTPDTSPVLGPLKSPDMNSDAKLTDDSTDNATRNSAQSFSLCDCCSTRNKFKMDHSQPNPIVECEFGHATHYKYNATTPRIMSDFETGTA